MSTKFQVTFDCADPDALAQFWAEALGYIVQPPPDGFESWDAALRAWNVPEEDFNRASALIDPDGDGPRLFFQRVPEGKTAKNRVHLDVNVGGGPDVPSDERKVLVGEAIERLVKLGATRGAEHSEFGSAWVVMADPEGNEFCLQ